MTPLAHNLRESTHTWIQAFLVTYGFWKKCIHRIYMKFIEQNVVNFLTILTVILLPFSFCVLPSYPSQLRLFFGGGDRTQGDKRVLKHARQGCIKTLDLIPSTVNNDKTKGLLGYFQSQPSHMLRTPPPHYAHTHTQTRTPQRSN